MIKSSASVNIEDLTHEMKEFIYKLEKKLSKELIITSGYRNIDHPVEASKNSPGEHTEGLAVDVYCKNPVDFLNLAGEAYRLGCRRIGVSRKNNFIHLGLSKNRPQSLWTY